MPVLLICESCGRKFNLPIVLGPTKVQCNCGGLLTAEETPWPEQVLARAAAARAATRPPEHELQSQVIALVRAEFDAEAATGFPRLKRVPATHFIRFLDYYASLDPTEQESLLDGIARFGCRQVFFTNIEYAECEQHPAYSRYLAMLNSPHCNGGYRYSDVKFLSLVPKMKELGGYGGWIRNWYDGYLVAPTYQGLALTPRPDLAPDVACCLKPAKPALLRPLLEAAFAKLFLPKKKVGVNTLLFEGPLEGSHVTLKVKLDPGLGGNQLTYEVGVSNPAHTFRVQYLPNGKSVDPFELHSASAGVGTSERLWAYLGGWDYLTEENAERSIAFLPEQVEYLVRLAERVNKLTLL